MNIKKLKCHIFCKFKMYAKYSEYICLKIKFFFNFKQPFLPVMGY